MKVNHETTKNAMLEIISILKLWAKYVNNYIDERVKVLENQNISDIFKQEQLNGLRTSYINKHVEYKERVSKQIEKIAEAEEINESILDFDVPQFNEIFKLIEVTKGKIPAETLELIKENFAGYRQALLALDAVFLHYGVDLKADAVFKEHIYHVNVFTDVLYDKAQSMELSEDSILLHLKSYHADLMHLAELLGICFDEDVKTFDAGISDEIQEKMARQAMGLPIE
ncbi:MAG: hypothetical protein IJE10_04940 [Clostridia bacterium]|nr:hypothetical protein [Clostridia bacterium]